MKKQQMIISICLLLCLVASGCKGETQPEQTQPSQTESVSAGEKVSNSHGYANMCLTIPDGWEYEITEYSSETGNFGIVFRPEGETVGSLSLMYYDGWALTGTGFEEKMDFIADREVGVGTYVGQAHWNYIRLRYMPGDYVFFNTGADIWYDQYADDIEKIIGSAVVAEGVMTYTQAEDIALSWAEEQPCGVYEVARSGFQMNDGVWEVYLGALNNTGPDRMIHIFPDGSVKEVVLPQE